MPFANLFAENYYLETNIEYWKERIEFVFIFLMALLLIYIFNPKIPHTNLLNFEVKLLIYLFGFILLITAEWKLFFYESEWFKYLQQAIGKTE